MAAAAKKVEDMSLEEFQAHQVAHWSKYVATEPISVYGARAFNVGDPVPIGHVESGLVDKSQVTIRPTEKEV